MTYKKVAKRVFFALSLLLISIGASAQKFYNLTEDEVRIDSIVPALGYSFPLPANYTDSIYTVRIAYPEFIDMPEAYSKRYDAIDGKPLPEMPLINQCITMDRKKPSLVINFCPYVERNGKRQMLVSFMLEVKATARYASKKAKSIMLKAAVAPADRYKSTSALTSGTWVKIRIPSTGIYTLTDNIIKKAGFTDLSKVKIYGYGGALENEVLMGSDLVAHDDVSEVATCTIGGRRLFHAQGPVSWSTNTATRRTRNPYSNYGYYFLTENDAAPLTQDSAAFVSSFYPSADDYHSLYEVDNFAWYQGGRNLFDSTPISVGTSKSYVFDNNDGATSAKLSVDVTAGVATSVSVTFNGKTIGTQNINLVEFDSGSENLQTYSLSSLNAKDTVKITTTSGGPARLDYISLTYNTPCNAPKLSKIATTEPEIVGKIDNQNLHADGQSDMVIIIPSSQKLLSEAERLKAHHEKHDSLRVTIIPADKLYNEFSSGTPDIGAYRRYLKMLYDRAKTDADLPKYVLLFGSCAADNRMATTEWSNYSPNDYLLCYESENSFSTLSSYVDDGFICLLDDGEGGNLERSDKPDIAVGRFPVNNEADAKIIVDKTINYAENKNAGAWENTLMFMGDDGNQNIHMEAANSTADMVANLHPEYIIKKVMWDAYQRETAADGNTYPEVAKLVKAQQQSGALIMNYIGHGNEIQISHEKVLRITDFANFTNTNLPLWVTAGCDLMPYDGTTANIGVTAMQNAKGGAVAFFGTTRTVLASYNERINKAFTRYVLSKADGKPVTVGEAQRLAKNEMITLGSDLTINKIQYQLLGDPALALNQPLMNVVIDSIAGVSVSSSNMPQLKAGMTAKVKGHIDGATNFNGIFTTTVRDVSEAITCRQNDAEQAEVAFVFNDRTKIIFTGSDSVKAGKVAFTFTVPKDISYGNNTGMINIYAVSSDKTLTAHGSSDKFIVGGSQINNVDSLGPTIYCYLNSPSFSNGGKVNTTPYFVAEINDPSGINATGNGIGHDMELIIDGEMSKTYILNDNFSYDFGSYTKGSTFYSIPELTLGQHKLQFRAWDVFNNPTTIELAFNVVKGLEPNILNVSCTKNPATTTTTFIINHDRMGSLVDVEIDVYDTSGRILWKHSESGVSLSSTYTVDWNLTTDSGSKLETGVYIYRVRLSEDSSSKASKAQKLIVIGN
jgi:hypothetical protein